jgi:ribosome maturation protein Sdo1
MAAKKSESAKNSSNKTARTKSKKQASPKGRSSSPSSIAEKDGPSAGELEVTIDRRRDQQTAAARPANLERRTKVQRRRQIDPTTCERDYSDQEVEFMNAMDDYKRKSGRMFPTCSEVLEVIRSLGYIKFSAAEMAVSQPIEASTPAEPVADFAYQEV